MIKVSFKPKQVTKKLLGALPDRARDVLEKRYGLGKDSSTQTLESIGQIYGITRERVRQIENYGIVSIRKSEAFKSEAAVFEELRGVIAELGHVIAEDELLNLLAKDDATKNHFFFLLVIGDTFNRAKDDAQLARRWHVTPEIAKGVEAALRRLHASVNEDDLIPEGQLIEMLQKELQNEKVTAQSDEVLRRWLALSQVLSANPLGEWGVVTSPNVRAKGVRDFAYLAVKRHGSPMHFREVAEAIEKLFARKAHVATCHNELIKDKRFVLVGRGLYALTEWGYTAGVVKDVLRDILEKHGPLSREEIIDRVRKERYVKDNTIIVNLQDTALFRRLPDGTYTAAQ